ncbi:reverse transcriptase domain-containing protein [Tanacetum coccineum]|uniref:Reverse transcriptase domain-containing protein n=1 Tax=Tanacetum coccineum TaxID=301880 RepID=A0ABQ5EQK3_9ASTR
MREVYYHDWLSNLVMVKKHDGSWRMCVDFTDLNKACPQDCYPLLEIEWKIKSLYGYPFKYFLDAYKGYHQIQMAESDEEKTAFHTSQGVYCYIKMPFGLKNAGATYQRLVDKAFDSQVGRNMEMYVDDLVIKSHTETKMLRDIDKMFRTLRKINMKLNPKKCTFGAVEGMFLGYTINPEGIKPCPDKTEAVLQLPSPRTIKKVQSLNRCDFHWTPEAKQAFKQLKQHLSELPLLVAPKQKEELIIYLSASYGAVSAVLMTKRGAVQTPVCFISRALQGLELNYTPMEKLIISRPDMAERLQKWSVMLGEHNITYRPRTSVKGQILPDFLVEKPDENPPDTSAVETPPEPWILFTDGSSCVDGSGAEYEALIAGLRIAAQMGVRNIQVSVDSKLVANQVLGTYGAKEENMITYLEKVKSLVNGFANFSISQIPRSKNKKADALSQIASTSFAHLSKQVLVEVLTEKSIQEKEVTTVVEEEGTTWMTPIMEYLKDGTLPGDRKEASKLRIKSRQYELMEGILYRRSFLKPWLRCVGPLQANYVIREIHEGSCSMHAGPRSVVAKVMRLGYYWSTMHRDARDMILYLADVEVDPSEVRLGVDVEDESFEQSRSRGTDLEVDDDVETSVRDPIMVSDNEDTPPMVPEVIPEPAQEDRAVEVQREQGHRTVGVESAFTALTERIAELERDNKRLRGTASVEIATNARQSKGKLHDIILPTSFTSPGSFNQGRIRRHVWHYIVQDTLTFRELLLLNLDHLEKQLDKEEFQETESIDAFRVLMKQFQTFINFRYCFDDFDGAMIRNQKDEGDSSKALDAGLVVTESNETESERHVSSSRSGKDTHAEDADINSVNDKQPLAEVQLTVQHDTLANEQQHSVQSEPIYDTHLLEKVDRNTIPDSTNMCHRGGEIEQNAKKCQVSCPLLDPSFDNMTTEFSNQSLESENIFLKKTVAQLQKDLSRMEAHCVNMELKYQNQALKDGQHGQILNETSNKAKINKEIEVLEKINIELEHSVASLLTKDHADSLIVQLNCKSVENADLKAQIQEKVFANVALKNELIKLKGNSVDTKFAKLSILGKPVLQPPRNQSVVRQPNAFTPHYLPKVRESVFAKPQHLIAPDLSRNSSKESYGSNDMAHNYYLEEAKKKTQDKNRKLKPREMPSAKTHNTRNACTPKPRSNNQTSRNWPASKSCEKTLKVVQKADHSRNPKVNSRAKIQPNTTRNSNKVVDPTSHNQKPGRKIITGHSFSPNKSYVVHEKTNTPRSCLRWISLGRSLRFWLDHGI